MALEIHLLLVKLASLWVKSNHGGLPQGYLVFSGYLVSGYTFPSLLRHTLTLMGFRSTPLPTAIHVQEILRFFKILPNFDF